MGSLTNLLSVRGKKVKEKRKENEDDMTVMMVINRKQKVDYPPPFPANLKEKGMMENLNTMEHKSYMQKKIMN